MPDDGFEILTVRYEGQVFTVGRLYHIVGKHVDDLFLLDKFVREGSVFTRVLASMDSIDTYPYADEDTSPFEEYCLIDSEITIREVPVEELPLFVSYPFLSPLFHETLTTLKLPTEA